MGCIYRIVCNATGQSYIGQTAYSHPFVRFREHRAHAEKGTAGALYDAMRTHGIDAFECICVCVAPNEALNDLECYYAEQYDAYTWMGGYNVGECGRCRIADDMRDATRLRIKRNAIWRNLRRQ